MADALPLPQDLINLQRDLYAAQQAAEDYGNKVSAFPFRFCLLNFGIARSPSPAT